MLPKSTFNHNKEICVEDLENQWNNKIDLSEFYNADKSNLNDEEKRFISPIYHSLIDSSKHYIEESFLRAGGEKSIYKVYDSAADRFVAMAKSINASLDSEKEHFLREARLTAALQHPNIISIYDMGIDSNNEAYFIMELLQGKTLKEVFNERKHLDPKSKPPYSRTQLLQIFSKICDSIAYANSRRVVHLDLKPDNISIGPFGDVTVFDWGLAQVLDQKCDKSSTKIDFEISLDAEILNDFTLKGKVKGTPSFMSPNQVDGGKADYSDDIYSLGVLLYQLLTNELPTKGGDLKTILNDTSTGNLVSIYDRDKTLPLGLCSIVDKALSLKPQQRYKSVNAMQEDLQKYLDGFATSAENASFIKLTHLLIKRHSRECALISLFLLVLSLIIYTAFERLKSEQEQTLNNFELYKDQVASTQKLTQELKSIIHQSEWVQEVATIQLMINKLDEVLTLEVEPRELVKVWQKKGELHFILEQFNQACQSFEKSKDLPLAQVSRNFAKIKPDDFKLLSPEQLNLLFIQNTSQFGKNIYYKTFYFHCTRISEINPQDYVPVVKNILDLLNNIKHEDVSTLSMTQGQKYNHLSLQQTPYTNFILPLPTATPFNVLSILNINSIDISKSQINDLEVFIGLNLPKIQAVNINFSYKVKVFYDLIGVREITLDPSFFDNNTLDYFRTKFELKEVNASEYFSPNK